MRVPAPAHDRHCRLRRRSLLQCSLRRQLSAATISAASDSIVSSDCGCGFCRVGAFVRDAFRARIKKYYESRLLMQQRTSASLVRGGCREHLVYSGSENRKLRSVGLSGRPCSSTAVQPLSNGASTVGRQPIRNVLRSHEPHDACFKARVARLTS